MTVVIAILAGGRSRRMGVDKALLEAEGRTLLERTAQSALATGRPTLVVGRTEPKNWPFPEVMFLSDPDTIAGERPEDGFGPMGGLWTVLHYVSVDTNPGTLPKDMDDAPHVLLLGCDMPRLTVRAIEWILSAAEGRGVKLGLVVRYGGRIEPLFSIYGAGLIPMIESRIGVNELSMQGLIKTAPIAYIDAPEDVGAALVNVNTPDEWQHFTS
jgi:molybdopterin-guanine dinucleotide biosynthesis protein A